MKGRDSAFGDITPCSTCVSFIRTRSLQRLPPSSFLQQQKRVGGASGQGNHLGDVPLGRSRVQLMLLQSRTPAPPPRPSPPRSWQEKGGNWSQVHDDRRMEGHAGLESDLGVQYQDVVLIYLLQAEFQASLPIPISITAFPTSSQYLLVCLLPLVGSDLSNLILPCCPLCPAVLLGSSPFCSSNPPSCSSPRAFAFAMPFPGSFSSVFMSSWVFRTVSP